MSLVLTHAAACFCKKKHGKATLEPREDGFLWGEQEWTETQRSFPALLLHACNM